MSAMNSFAARSALSIHFEVSISVVPVVVFVITITNSTNSANYQNFPTSFHLIA